MENVMGKDYLNKLMAIYIVDHGKMEKNMDKEPIFLMYK
jgi:hypothetical protein